MSVGNRQQSIVLIVDDNPTNLGVLFDSLYDSGFKVLVAQDGMSAIEQLQYIKPDLILLDVMMPGIDGFETCRRLKADEATRDIPVIFMTALVETVDKVRGLRIGAVDYVTKPIEHEEVLARITTHLTLQNLSHQLQENNEHLQQEINERKRAEEALRVFFHAVSHDLRNPVAGMLIVLRNLLAKQTEEQQSGEQSSPATAAVPVSTLERMIHSSERQLELINSLLETHINETQGMVLQPETIQLQPLAQAVILDLEPLLVQNQVVLTNLIPLDLPRFSADPAQLWRVLENLITNALKHNSPGIMVRLNAEVQDKFIRCTVEDNGVGLNLEEGRNLFDLYERGTQSQHSSGLGLGLYLCRQIIEGHGGQIGVVSGVGTGATFWFTLPC
ncbi:hybrid sensor histidine kinase/response regulator [Leptolyngbya sp. FACHB-261]|uniref:hybrid sensor histidine kinase/response regulator n=1 Tax=Leptolyngbya sp. FACHB-261 TaxID=2692806 RepID=UPI001682EF35|nr:hybrid sensor histidine kinase/response regulator [Leptolyngbya sp. FACHB-261]MBD2102464.1 hybrid sensor histidine kinase/response regulator [Leptolyngbya sp. FACHB-261]